MRTLVIGIVLFIAALSAHALAQTANTFNVTASFSPLEWMVGGQVNPTLTLTRGQTYTFNLTGTNGHTFFIKTTAGAGVLGSTDAFSEGVTNNGLATGTLTFAVPADAPAQLVYQCGIHSVMTGSLLIQTPTPTMGSYGVALLTLVLLGAGLIAYRRREAARVQI